MRPPKRPAPNPNSKTQQRKEKAREEHPTYKTVCIRCGASDRPLRGVIIENGGIYSNGYMCCDCCMKAPTHEIPAENAPKRRA